MRLKEDAEFFTCEYCGNVHFPAPNEDGVRVLGDAAAEKCPVCAVSLVHAAIGGHRIRYCARCRGMLIAMNAFTAITADLRSRRDALGDSARQPDWSDLDRKLRCPQCGSVMDTHPYGGPGNVIIDDCEVCTLVWLDFSELDRIVRAPDFQYASDITSQNARR
jgi:Zn-finger nucleic acid-binding protein